MSKIINVRNKIFDISRVVFIDEIYFVDNFFRFTIQLDTFQNSSIEIRSNEIPDKGRFSLEVKVEFSEMRDKLIEYWNNFTRGLGTTTGIEIPVFESNVKANES